MIDSRRFKLCSLSRKIADLAFHINGTSVGEKGATFATERRKITEMLMNQNSYHQISK